RERQRTQRVLVVAQLTLAVLLLSGAGLLMRSLVRLQQVDPGFRAENVLIADLSLPQARYDGPGQVGQFYGQLLERVRGLPGVRDAAAVSSVPLGGPNAGTVFAVEGRPLPDPSAVPDADYRSVTPGYFRLMDIPLLRGRDFTEQDDSSASPVVILSATTAQRNWPGLDPLGSRIRLGDVVKGPLAQVIGVVGDVRHLSLESPEQRPMLYFPLRRTGQPGMSVLLRTAGPPAGLNRAVRGVVRGLDPALPITGFRTLGEVVDAAYAPQRFNLMVLGLFAGAALLLAAIGLHGVMAYSVRQRTHEIGVRLALGAERGGVVRMVLGDATRLVVTGILLGLGGALLLNRSLKALLFGVAPGDPLALAAASAVLLGIGLLGSYAPARRAAAVDPMRTLREE
ncbi:MAG TPA: ABC transporter permease, partial [Gemmatimonadales bacterium]|nr:ABC transporter permease [Gemmatimonadales bacterium]